MTFSLSSGLHKWLSTRASPWFLRCFPRIPPTWPGSVLTSRRKTGKLLLHYSAQIWKLKRSLSTDAKLNGYNHLHVGPEYTNYVVLPLV